MSDGLHLIIRTPHEVVLDERVVSARVPTVTGQVGIRPREEPILLAVEPGLVLLRIGDTMRFAATGGGLLDGDRDEASIYTPFAVVGDEADAVVAALQEELATPESEVAARRRLGELEERIVQELRHRPKVAKTRGNHG